ncbi:MAG TPA: hypothetical protein V6D10_22835 [Trichocoleus sp.]|jgi:hypothetical protein
MLRYPFFNRKENRRKEERQDLIPAKVDGFVLQVEQLETLAQQLQDLLELQVIPQQCQVRCATNQGTLLILVEHLLHVEPDVQHLLLAIEAVVRENTPELIQRQFPQVVQAHLMSLVFRTYIRIAGHNQPYQSHNFTLDFTPPHLKEDSFSSIQDTALEPSPSLFAPAEMPVIEPEIDRSQASYLKEESQDKVSDLSINEEVDETENVIIESEEETDYTSAPIEIDSFVDVQDTPALQKNSLNYSSHLDRPGITIEQLEHGDLGLYEAQNQTTQKQVDETFELVDSTKETVVNFTANEADRESALAPDLESSLDIADEEIQDEISPLDVEAGETSDAFVKHGQLGTPVTAAEISELEAIEPGFHEVNVSAPIEPLVPPIAAAEVVSLPEAEPEDAVPDSLLDVPVETELYTLSEPITEREPEQIEPELPDAIEPSEAVVFPLEIEPPLEAVDESVLETKTPVEQIALVVSSPRSAASHSDQVAFIEPSTSAKSRFGKQLSPSAIIFFAVVGVFAVGSGIYMLSRPCVIGVCKPLEQAQQSSTAAIDKIQNTNSALEVVDAYEQLTQASDMLSTIPPWSSHYETAQGLMMTYENQAKLVEQAVKALRQANKAALKSQNPPHPLQQWREVQWLWRDAIAQMQKVAVDSPMYGLAQRKLQEYEANLAGINDRVIAEQNAQDRVNVARKTAQVAEARAGIANSAEAWQQVYATWSAAIKLLQQIPQGTMASGEAQQLLALYQPKLNEAEQKQSQESIAVSAYNQAVQFADQARNLEEQNQWEQAASVWQNALTKIQQIPTNTAYSNQAQTLVSAYTTALNQAETNRTRYGAMQSQKAQLDRTCRGNPEICTYTFTPQAIRVQITRTYDRLAERTITSSQSGTVSAPPATVNQVDELLRSLAAISEQAQVPIELYNADGSKFGTYAPDVSGYVQQ